MNRILRDERGAAMVLALGALAVLAVIAFIVVAIVSSEKRTAFFDYSSSRSFYSADAATEAGVHWLRGQNTPPPIVAAGSKVFHSTAYTALSADHQYTFDIQYVRKKPRPGYSLEYRDYEYLVGATGASAKGAETAIDVNATRLYREGY